MPKYVVQSYFIGSIAKAVEAKSFREAENKVLLKGFEEKEVLEAVEFNSSENMTDEYTEEEINEMLKGE